MGYKSPKDQAGRNSYFTINIKICHAVSVLGKLFLQGLNLSSKSLSKVYQLLSQDQNPCHLFSKFP